MTFAFSSAALNLYAAPSKETSETPPASIYQTIPPGKSLRNFSSFYIVDDFDERQPKNRFGAPWRKLKPARGRFKSKLSTEDALQKKRGGSLLFKTSLAAGVTGGVKTSLMGRDASRAQAFILQCRIQTPKSQPFSGTLEVQLSDLEGRSVKREVCGTGSGRTGTKVWREVALSKNDFSAINPGRLGELAFWVTGGERAEIGIDEVAFYGPENLEFESKKDNLIGFPDTAAAQERREELLSEDDTRKFLYEIAKDTWKYFENALDQNTSLPVDHIRVGKESDIGAYTTPTNLAMYLLACISARELDLISKKEAVRRIRETLETLRIMKRWKGFHYNFYDSNSLVVTRPYVSAVDSGWLAAALVVVKQAFPKELGGLAGRFLDEIDFYEFYDPAIGQLRLGYDENLGQFSPYHYGLIATEARVASFVGIGKGDLPREHWWFIYRTPPSSWDWQNQKPEGREVEFDRVSFFQGHYLYKGRKFVPSWGGSMFEFLMPPLVIKEKELAPKGIGLNNQIATMIQVDYALNRQGYPLWGLSPASVASGRQWRYGEYGVKYLGAKGYRDEGIITPYAAFLALETLPSQAIDNVRRMLQLYEIYGEYGYFDSVNVRSGRVNSQYLALDQGMILAAITNYLQDGVLRNYFHKDSIGKSPEDLLTREEIL